MERHSNLSFFLIISLAFHLSLVLLLRTTLLKPELSSEGSLAEVELLQMPPAAIIGDFPTKLQQFSGGREKGGLSGKGNVSTEFPLPSPKAAPGSDLTVPVGKPTEKPREAAKPAPSHPPVASVPSPAEIPAPAFQAPAPSAQVSSSPPVASAPTFPGRGETPPLPAPLPLLRDQNRELAKEKEESPLDFPRMKIPFINEKDLDKMARTEPRVQLPEKNKGMTLDLDDFKFGPYGMSVVEKVEKVWKYPDEAARKGMQGILVVGFIINKDGSIKDMKLLNSSGFGVLDDEAMRALRAAAPFKPLPGNIGLTEFPVRFTFVYEIIRRGIYVH